MYTCEYIHFVNLHGCAFVYVESACVYVEIHEDMSACVEILNIVMRETVHVYVLMGTSNVYTYTDVHGDIHTCTHTNPQTLNPNPLKLNPARYTLNSQI